MKTINHNPVITKIMFEVAHEHEDVSKMVNAIKALKLDASSKYAYQAFCCAMLAKQAKGLLQKGKYIKEYGHFIEKAVLIDLENFDARLIRIMVEKKLNNVTFKSHAEEDLEFLVSNLHFVNNEHIKSLTYNALQ